MMKSTATLAAAAGLCVALAACNGGAVTPPPFNTGANPFATPLPSNPTVSTQSYKQIELLARPAVKEVFENFNDHKTTNAVEPYAGAPADPLPAEIVKFEDTVRPPNAGAGTDYGKTLASILYPNEYTVDLSSTDKASYLGVETGGATGGKFGGRDVGDDVIDISLGALFGNTLSALKVVADDGEENNCLSAENVTQAASQSKIASFPYLAPPH